MLTSNIDNMLGFIMLILIQTTVGAHLPEAGDFQATESRGKKHAVSQIVIPFSKHPP